MTTVLDLTVPHQAGLSALAAQVREARPAAPRTPSDALASLFEAELRLGLEAGDPARAGEAALAVWRRSGDLQRCHRAVGRVLADVGAACAQGVLPVATGNRVAAAATSVVAQLRARTAPGTGSRVVLATLEGDHHVLALESLAHLLEDAGHRADAAGALPVHELVAVSAGAAAVVLSVHVGGVDLRKAVTALRHAHPQLLVAVGGPAAGDVPEADLRTEDVPSLLAALRAGACPLSEREREVLRCVADGLTNADAAAALGVAPATLKTHLDHVFDKTGTSGRAAAVAVALRQGWIR